MTQMQLDMETEAPPRADLTKCGVIGCGEWAREIIGAERVACWKCRRYNRISKRGWKDDG